MEDFGDERLVDGDPPAPIEERYAAAVDLLAALHRRELPDTLPVTSELDYRLPPYDMEAFLIEAELLLDWYLLAAGAPATDGRAQSLRRSCGARRCVPAIAAPPTWVLRDYHSPNLLWLPQRDGIARIGLLDFQDALIGPAAYDVASLLQDARVDVPEAMEMALLSRYVRARLNDDRSSTPPASRASMRRWRRSGRPKSSAFSPGCDRRDGKPQYLRHMPRLWNYLQRSLAHPALASLKAWYATNVPAPDGL